MGWKCVPGRSIPNHQCSWWNWLVRNPRHIKFDGLSWPVWTHVNPLDHLDIIKKTWYWPILRQNNQWMSDADYAYRVGNPKTFDADWDDFAKPFYLRAFMNGTLKMERANIAFVDFDGNYQNTVIMRFRIVTTVRERLSRNILPSDKTDQWQYVMVSDDHSALINNTPISHSGNVLAGELAIVNGNLIIFETNYVPTYEIEEIVINPPTIGGTNEFGAIGVAFLCQNQVSAQ